MIQLNTIKTVILKNIFWIILLYIFLIINTITLNSELFFTSLDSFIVKVYDLFGLTENISLLIIYKEFLIIFLTYNFFTYEFRNAGYNIYLRVNKVQVFTQKVICLFLLIVIIDICYLSIINYSFSSILSLNALDYLRPILVDLCIMSNTLLFNLIFKKKGITIVLVFIISYIYFKFHAIYLTVIFFALSIILSSIIFTKTKYLHKLDLQN